MHRLIALIAFWSYDYTLDITHDDPELASPDEGPNEHFFLMVKSWPNTPSDHEIKTAMTRLRDNHLNYDGHAELHSHAVLNEIQWNAFQQATARPTPNTLSEPQPDPSDPEPRPKIIVDCLKLPEALGLLASLDIIIVHDDRGHLPANAPALSIL